MDSQDTTTYHWVITLMGSEGHMAMRDGTYILPAGGTRQKVFTDVLARVRSQLGPHYANACVTHWSLDLNAL
ncbi:hypothetical protein Srufu_079830 (plasmid) [Streptomyces libani subsp. rufus]|nr:hypothetical protein Srufu_079830 [Streptomyces libani subsp. rufus]